MANIIRDYLTVNNTFDLLFLITIIILILLAIREICCWYYKINDIKKLLENIDSNISLLVNQNIREKNTYRSNPNDKKTEPTKEGHMDSITYRDIVIEEDENKDLENNKSDETDTVSDKIVKSQKSLKEILTHKYYISDLFNKKNKD